MGSRARGTGYVTARSPSKAQLLPSPGPPRTGRKPKKRRSLNDGRIYGGAPSSSPQKPPRPFHSWFGSASRGPRVCAATAIDEQDLSEKIWSHHLRPAFPFISYSLPPSPPSLLLLSLPCEISLFLPFPTNPTSLTLPTS